MYANWHQVYNTRLIIIVQKECILDVQRVKLTDRQSGQKITENSMNVST